MAFETHVFARVGDVALAGDLYRPDGPGPHPVLVAAPGGAWRYNRREELRHWGEHLAGQGFALFAIDYHRAERGPSFPRNVEDVGAAIDFIHKEGGVLGLDPARIGLMGASAGAHLCALAAFTGEPRPVKVVVLVYGVYDLFAHWEADRWRNMPAGEDPTERMLGASRYDDPELYFRASPRLRLTRARAAGMKVLLAWGAADEAVLPDQSRGFARALQQAGAFVRTEEIPGAGHFWFSNHPITEQTGFTAVLAPRLVRFLKQHLAAPAG